MGPEQDGETKLLEPRPDVSRERDGRDEMNLAEYPIALLADRAPAGIKTVVYHDKDETVTITGSDLLGLPTALDVDVIIGLLHLTKKKNNFESTTLHFTRYELMKVLGWPDRGFYYERLTESLNRWVGVMLIYKKSWWDNDAKTKGNYSFHILEAASVIEQQQRRGCQTRQIALPLSTIRWSSEFFKSFQANNLKKLDLQVYFSLKSSISKQLYRFLDKRFYRKAEWTFDLRTLACEHVGMSRNYECWRLKQKLQPAIHELTERGFLKAMDSEQRFTRTGRGQWSVSFGRSGALSTTPQVLPADGGGEGDEPSELESELVARGVSAKTARDLVASFPEERVRAQIEQVDWVKKKGAKKILDLGAYLTKAVRDEYSRPEGFVSNAEKAEQQRVMNERRKLEAAEAKRKRDHAKRCDEANSRVREYWDGLSNEEREVIDAEAVVAADPEFVRVYEQTAGRGGSFAASLFRLSIRNPFIRTKLGLPQDDANE